MAAEVNDMTTIEIMPLHGWHSDAFSMQFAGRGGQLGEILFVRENDDVAITAKFRCAVEHAGLTADKQVPYFVA